MGDPEIPSVLQKLQKWGDYPGYGETVHPTRFIPCKTPMSCQIIASWSLPEEPKHSLTIPSLLRDQAGKGRRLGLLIDLSNHETLYSEDLSEASLQYVHINLVAKVFPQQEAIDRVIKTARTFWQEHPTEHIAIHCAYGFNRTGFVVCAYLILACGMTVDEALSSFGTARPPGVRHEKFVDELRRRYDTPKEVEPAPLSRSSFSSLRSDMACVAEFLDDGPGMEALKNGNVNAHEQSSADAENPKAVSSYGSFPAGPPSSWGGDSIAGAASMREAEPLTSLKLRQSEDAVSSGYGSAPSNAAPPSANGSCASGPGESASIPIARNRKYHSASLGSQASINNDSLGLEQRQIFDSFFDEAAKGAAAARAENKGRRRPGSGSDSNSRRWQRSMLPCISAADESNGSPISPPSELLTASTASADCIVSVSQSEKSSMANGGSPEHFSSPFASVQGLGLDHEASDPVKWEGEDVAALDSSNHSHKNGYEQKCDGGSTPLQSRSRGGSKADASWCKVM